MTCQSVETLQQSLSSRDTSPEVPLAQAQSIKTRPTLQSPYPHHSSDQGPGPDGLDLFLRSINRHPQQHEDLLSKRQETHVLDCVSCTLQGDTLAEQIQCSQCFLWSHVPCIKLQFDLEDDVLLKGDALWLCPGRCNKSTPLWKDELCVKNLPLSPSFTNPHFSMIYFSIGNCIFYRTALRNGKNSTKLYAGRISERHGMYATLEWYPGNIYTKGEEPRGENEVRTLIPIHQCARAMANQSKHYRKHQVRTV